MVGSVFSMEGIGDEVTYSFIAFALFISLLGIYCFKRSHRRDQMVHPQEQDQVNSIRESMEVVPRRRYNEENQCPVCLNDVQYCIETNCGHIFCCRCFSAYQYHGNFIGAVRCPVCRQQVKILFQCFTVNELNPVEGSVEEEERNNMLRDINTYNRRFSGEPRAVLDYLRDLPTVLRHLWSEFFSVGGLIYVFRMRILILLLIGLLYLLSPLDILPEAVYGLLGLVDDIFVLLSLCVYLSIMYHSYIAGRA